MIIGRYDTFALTTRPRRQGTNRYEIDATSFSIFDFGLMVMDLS
jgi:hypothetical protein